jgi:hypothetical protein
MPIDWDAIAKKVAGAAVQVGKRVAERGIDGLLEDADEALVEGRKRVKQARSRIHKPAAKQAPVDEEPKRVVIEATLEEDE